MICSQNLLRVFFTLSLLSCAASAVERAPQLSLWGKVANFKFPCSHWRLKPQVSIPALKEFTVCLNVQLQAQDRSPWTAFMYRHPTVQSAELGLGGEWGQVVVWLFGMKFTTATSLDPKRWYALCLTWSHRKPRPALYVDGNLVNFVSAQDLDISTPGSPPCSQLIPNGTLTLGASYMLVNGKPQIIELSSLWGKVSLFRLWGHERSKEEVMSLHCTEGDLVKWEQDNWDNQTCPPVPDRSLKCEWSIYEVRLLFAIFRDDGNNTELYTVRDIAHNWLRKVLPTSIYLHRVSVFEAYRLRAGTSVIKPSHEETLVRWVPDNISRFNCLVYISVIPSLDVADVQDAMHKHLSVPYNDPSGTLRLLAEDDSIHTTPVESFSTSTTASPPVATTELTPVTTAAFTTTSITPRTPTTTATATAFTATPANISELYFEVEVNVSITGDCDPEQTLSTWLNTSLPDDKMMVLDLQLLTTTQRRRLKRQSSIYNRVLVFGVSRESCVFQVQVKMLQSDTQEMEKEIQDLLEKPYKIGSISVATEDILISRIFKFQCDAETHHTRKGVFKWPATSGGKNASLPCPKPHNCLPNATRHCKICINTHWLDPDMKDCPLVVETIPDLDHVDVTTENAQDVVDMIDSLLGSHSTLNYDELATILDKLEAIMNLSVLTPTLGQSLINVISDILKSESNLLPFTNTILNITEAVGDRMMGYEGSASLVAPALAVSVVDVASGEFSTLSFGVLSDRVGLKPEIFINMNPLNGTVAFISLPSVLQHNFPESGPNQSHPRVQFQFYGFPGLFKLLDAYPEGVYGVVPPRTVEQSRQKGQTLHTFVVSASVTNASSPIKDLEDYVKVTLHHLVPNNLYKDAQCVYWNFNLNNGQGGWDGYGCTKFNGTPDYTTCQCDHLTHFGVLLDVSRTEVDPVNKHILTIITYVGCGVSSLFLGVTVLTYTAFEKLRRDYPSQILINLSLALLGLNLVFLVNSWLSSWGLYGLCVAVASTLHYFLLASFTWMGLEAVNMYFALVKVFNVYVPSYILKFCALGWGIPLVICVLVLIVNREAYGSNLYTHTQPSVEPLDNSDNFCWLQDDVAFYVSVVAYAVLVFLFNIAVFVVVLIQIRRMRDNSPAGTHGGLMKDLKGVASLTLLLGLTWTVGFLTWGPARITMLFLFSGLNSLQGLFIFLFHCLMKENVRKQWRIHLCFGRFRLEEYSEASNSASVGVVAKPKSNPPRASVPSVRSVKSSSTESTSASSDSSQRDSSCKRPGLGLFVNGLVLPRAQTGPSAPEALNSTPGWRNHLLGQHGTG